MRILPAPLSEVMQKQPVYHGRHFDGAVMKFIKDTAHNEPSQSD